MNDGRDSFQPNCRNGKLGSVRNGKFMAVFKYKSNAQRRFYLKFNKWKSFA